MTPQRKIKRRIHPDIQLKIEQLADEGLSPKQIFDKLPEYEDLDPDKLPTLRTVERICRDLLPPDPSTPWAIGDSGIDPSPVLAVLRSVVLTTRGQVTSFTRAQARWIAIVHRAAPDLASLQGGGYAVYKLAMSYLRREGSSEPTIDLDQFLAFAPWRGRPDLADCDPGWADRGWENYEKLITSGLVKELAIWRMIRAIVTLPRYGIGLVVQEEGRADGTR